MKKIDKKYLYFFGFLIFGLIVTFHRVILSGFDLMPGSILDARLINYILEHIYSWILQIENHRDLFTMPFYYPMKDNLFYSDTYLSVAPIYILFRIIFRDVYYAYTFTIISFFILNYISFYFLLKKLLKISPLFNAMGAYIYTFMLCNYYHMVHPQMLTQFFTIFAFLCIFSVNKRNSDKKNYLYFGLSGFLMACQFYSSYYLGYFAYLGCLLVGLLYLPKFCMSKRFRKKIYINLIRYRKHICLAMFILVTMLAPLGYMYVNSELKRDISEMYQPMNVFWSGSVLWHRFMPHGYYISTPWYKNNFGYFTLLIGCLGLFKIQKKYVLLILICYLIMLPSFPYKLPDFAFHYIPGSTAVRYWYRTIYLMLPFLAIGIIKFLSTQKNIMWVILLSVLIFLEQIPVVDSFGWSRGDEMNKMKFLSKKIPMYCKVIIIDSINLNTYAYIDSMWLAHYRNIYTRVGYSGRMYGYFDMPEYHVLPECKYIEHFKVNHPINYIYYSMKE